MKVAIVALTALAGLGLAGPITNMKDCCENTTLIRCPKTPIPYGIGPVCCPNCKDGAADGAVNGGDHPGGQGKDTSDAGGDVFGGKQAGDPMNVSTVLNLLGTDFVREKVLI